MCLSMMRSNRTPISGQRSHPSSECREQPLKIWFVRPLKTVVSSAFASVAMTTKQSRGRCRRHDIGLSPIFPPATDALVMQLLIAKPFRLRIVERQDVSGDAIQKPAIMRNHNDAADVVQNRFFECP